MFTALCQKLTEIYWEKNVTILWGFDQKYKPAIDVSEKNKPQFFGKMITTTQQLFSLVIFFI